MRLVRLYGAYICLMLLLVISQPAPGELVVAVLNIGQGDAIYIKSPSGIEVLIDGGPDSSILRELPRVMSYADRTIDAVIATHPDADHIGGLVDLVPRYEIKNFIEPGIPKGTATAAKLQEEVAAKNIPRTLASRGMWLDLGGGARLDILFPDFDVSNLPDNKANEGCVVARLVYKNTSALFTCDISAEIEAHLLVIASSTELQSDLLKIPHHGSKYSSSDAFLAAVNPDFAAVSAGERNRYGHPTEEVLSRVSAHGIQIYRTDEFGTVIFVSDGNDFKIR
jgi:competence protein ComEC